MFFHYKTILILILILIPKILFSSAAPDFTMRKFVAHILEEKTFQNNLNEIFETFFQSELKKIHLLKNSQNVLEDYTLLQRAFDKHLDLLIDDVLNENTAMALYNNLSVEEQDDVQKLFELEKISPELLSNHQEERAQNKTKKVDELENPFNFDDIKSIYFSNQESFCIQQKETYWNKEKRVCELLATKKNLNAYCYSIYGFFYLDLKKKACVRKQLITIEELKDLFFYDESTYCDKYLGFYQNEESCEFKFFIFQKQSMRIVMVDNDLCIENGYLWSNEKCLYQLSKTILLTDQEIEQEVEYKNAIKFCESLKNHTYNLENRTYVLYEKEIIYQNRFYCINYQYFLKNIFKRKILLKFSHKKEKNSLHLKFIKEFNIDYHLKNFHDKTTTLHFVLAIKLIQNLGAGNHNIILRVAKKDNQYQFLHDDWLSLMIVFKTEKTALIRKPVDAIALLKMVPRIEEVTLIFLQTSILLF